jgi:hypothetical protein
MTQVESLIKRLQDLGVKNIGISRGTNPNVTSEELAIAIHKMLDQLESGDYEMVDTIGDADD